MFKIDRHNEVLCDILSVLSQSPLELLPTRKKCLPLVGSLKTSAIGAEDIMVGFIASTLTLKGPLAPSLWKCGVNLGAVKGTSHSVRRPGMGVNVQLSYHERTLKFWLIVIRSQVHIEKSSKFMLHYRIILSEFIFYGTCSANMI